MDDQKLTAEQRQLLDNFDNLNDKGKQLLLRLSASLNYNPDLVRGGQALLELSLVKTGNVIRLVRE